MFSSWFEVFAGLGGVIEYRYDLRTKHAQRRFVAELPAGTRSGPPRDCCQTPPLSKEDRALMSFVEKELHGR